MRKALLKAARVTAVSGRQFPDVDRAALWGPDISQELQEAIAAALWCPGMFSMVGMCRCAAGMRYVLQYPDMRGMLKADHRLW